jgi:acyl-CoA dehydrogenase
MFKKLLNYSKKVIPKISETERIALNSGTISIDKDIFSGFLDKKKLIRNYKYPTISNNSIINSTVNDLCNDINDYEIYKKSEIPDSIYEKIANSGLYGMIIPSVYYGLELNHHTQSQIVQKISTASNPVGITVMVPNSLGPAELLLKYGTDIQKNTYLPKLADGTLLPCFGLTGPHSGSDAASMRDTGVVFEEHNKKFIKLNVSKRYITLAPIANLIGIAFILKDPSKLLRDGKEGITLILTDRKSLNIGDCHNPMGVPFKNGTIKAHDVVLPIDSIIGGEIQAGNGWKMLMECLAVGRAISLPACAVGSAKLTTNYVGAYSVYRKQFKTMLADMEGVQEKLSSVASETVKITSMQYLTNSILDNYEKPSVISALMKYETTERARKVVNNGMDIVAGAGICKGPRNYLANIYQATPIGITVEGSNILTKNLIIFGQGLMKSHPYLYNIVQSIENSDEKLFETQLKNIIFHSIKNYGKSLYYQTYSNLMIMSNDENILQNKYTANFAITSNLILLLGKKFKTSEFISGRMAEILGSLYILNSLDWFHHHNPCLKDIIKVAKYEEFQKIQNNFDNILNNYPIYPVKLLMKPILGKPFNSSNFNVTDVMIKKSSDAITKNIEVRKLLSENIYMNERLTLMNDKLEEVLKYQNSGLHNNEELNSLIDEVITVDSFKQSK